jgi:hypothetical protein
VECCESRFRDSYLGEEEEGMQKSVVNPEGWPHKYCNCQSRGYFSGVILDKRVTFDRAGLCSNISLLLHFLP